MNKKFLEQIADYYAEGDRRDAFTHTTFVFPNKRAALFMKRHLTERLRSGYAFMPQFKTFAHLSANLSGLVEPTRNERLFMLYRAYAAALSEKAAGRSDKTDRDQPRDFDKFLFWGQMILDDFDEIDRSLADPVKLYANLEALRDIAADYLTDKQKEIIRRIWGETNFTEHIQSFWFHTAPGDKEPTRLTRKFITLWQILARIYEIFRHNLAQAGLATPGMQAKLALKALEDTPLDELRRHNYVFIGFSELSNAEIAMMQRLQRAGSATFFWDLASPLFRDHRGYIARSNRAFDIVDRLAQEFPMPDDFELETPAVPPVIDIVGIASSVGQAKMAGQYLSTICPKDGSVMPDPQALDTAIVVPDPSQLMSLLLSMPAELPAINVTMALPYSSTTFATFFRAIISMQRRQRRHSDGRVTFFFEDVLEVLVHPHVQKIVPERANSIRQYIFDQRLFNLDANALVEEFPEIAFIFSPIADDSLQATWKYVSTLIDGIRRNLTERSSKAQLAETQEIDFLNYLERELSQLNRLIDRHNITMQESTFMSLFESILQSKHIDVEGTPLKGVQVMGVLETRCLDFDDITFLAMNERTFPRRDYVRTMIPNNLRRGYGLPPVEQSESFYAYHFYRAISRASHVTLLYDTRSGSRGAGEMSRYLAQLVHLAPAGVKVNSVSIDLSGRQHPVRPITIEKTPEILAQLRKYTEPGGKNISASALKSFMKCPLLFYLKYVNGITDDDMPVDYISPADLGDIFHRTAKRIYDTAHGQLIDDQLLEAWSRSSMIDDFLREDVALKVLGLKKVPASIYDMKYEAILVITQISAQLRSMFIAEAEWVREHGPYTFVDAELDVVKPWTLRPDLTINFRMQIDRVDRLHDGLLRFVDYKTGGDRLQIGRSIDNLFTPGGNSAVFQLFTYAEAYHDLVDDSVEILPALLVIRDIVTSGRVNPITLTVGNKPTPIAPFPAYSAEFRPQLVDLVARIFDPVEPFGQTDDIEDCRYCSFNSICGRNIPERNF